MRTTGAAFLAALLFVTPALAQTLAPGHPAGVQNARIGSTYLYAGAATGIFVGVLLAISNVSTTATSMVISVQGNTSSAGGSSTTTTTMTTTP